MSDTNGWAVTRAYAPDGAACLSSNEYTTIDVVHNERPLTAPQLRAFAADCVKAAEELEAEAND